MKSSCFFVFLLAVSALCAGYWDAPDKLEKLNAQTPGRRLIDMEPGALMKEAALEAMARWKGPQTDEAFSALAEQREPRYGIGTDAEIGAQIPSALFAAVAVVITEMYNAKGMKFTAPEEALNTRHQ